MEVLEHKLIPRRDFETIFKWAKAVDRALGLWYSSHRNDASMDKIAELSTNLTGQRVTLESILRILQIDREFLIVKENQRLNESSPYVIGVPMEDKKSMGQLIEKRGTRFVEKINQWIERNPNETAIKPVDLSVILFKKSVSPSKISKHSGDKKRSLSKDLRNDSSKYKYRERDEKDIKEKNKGLSLLERIRQKEAARSNELANKSPLKQYDIRIKGKMVPVYEIIYQVRGTGEHLSYRSYPLSKIMQTIMDSLGYPISEDDLRDVLAKLEEVLGNEKIQGVSREKFTVIKVKNLDRKQDLETLKRTLGNFKE